MVLHIWLIAKFGFMDDHLFFYIFLERSPLVLHVPIDDRHFLANDFYVFYVFSPLESC
jgi:hypothetical protein